MINASEHIGLIRKIALKLMKVPRCRKVFGDSVDGYYGVGYIGLANAIKDYTPDCGCKFSTFAGNYIKWQILAEVDGMDFVKVNKTLRYKIRKNQRDNFTEETWRCGQQALLNDVQSISGFDVGYQEEDSLDEEYLNKALKSLIKHGWRYYHIVKQYYGIGCIPEKDKSIAKRMKLSIQHVGYLRRKALNFLKLYFKNNLPEEYAENFS